MKPGYEAFMAKVAEARMAQGFVVDEIVSMMRAGNPEEVILHQLGVTVHADPMRAATAAMVALYRLAELEAARFSPPPGEDPFAEAAEAYFAEHPELDPELTSLEFDPDGNVTGYLVIDGPPGMRLVPEWRARAAELLAMQHTRKAP